MFLKYNVQFSLKTSFWYSVIFFFLILFISAQVAENEVLIFNNGNDIGKREMDLNIFSKNSQRERLEK